MNFNIFFYCNYTVQHQEQQYCWNGATEEINIIIIIMYSLTYKTSINYIFPTLGEVYEVM